MSGHKRATITARAENIRKLSQTEMAVRFVQAGLQELSQRLDQSEQHERELSRIQEDTQNQQLIQALSVVDEAFGRLEADTSAALNQQEQDFFQQMSDYENLAEQSRSYQIAEIHAGYQTALDELSEQHELSLSAISEQVDNLLQENQSLDLTVDKWIDASSTLLQAITQHPAGYFLMDTLLYTQMIDQAVENHQAGYKEAALISAQNAYREISQARIHLNHLFRQYTALCRLVDKNLQLLDQEIELNKQVHVLDLQGNPLEMEIWVDDWVAGNLGQLQQEIRSAMTWLEKQPSPARLEQFRQVLKFSVPRWQALLSEYVYQARSEVINSQLRMNTAMTVIRTLETQGYKLERSTYRDGDMRSGYRAQLTDSQGSRVLVQVEHPAGMSEAMELNLFTQDADKRTPHELKQRSIEIQRSLRRAGLHIGDLTPVVTNRSSHDRRQKKPVYQVNQESSLKVHDER